MEGFIQLHRQLLEWEWYDDINTKVLFIHLLLKANWRDKEWRGKMIERGSLITSLENLSKETGLSVREIRTSITKLKTTNEITYEGQANFSIVKLNKYNDYQANDKENDKPATNDRQASDKPATTTNKNNNTNKEINDIVPKGTELSLKPITQDINNLIKELKDTADSLGLAYNKKEERNFAKHILTAKEFGNFCQKIGQSPIEFAKNIMIASEKIRFFKGICTGPESIYKHYAEVYNEAKMKIGLKKQQNNIIITDEI